MRCLLLRIGFTFLSNCNCFSFGLFLISWKLKQGKGAFFRRLGFPHIKTGGPVAEPFLAWRCCSSPLYGFTHKRLANCSKILKNKRKSHPQPTVSESRRTVRGRKLTQESLWCRMKAHLVLNKVNIGDAVFMTGQHRAIGRTASKPGDPNYFLPGDNDRVSQSLAMSVLLVLKRHRIFLGTEALDTIVTWRINQLVPHKIRCHGSRLSSQQCWLFLAVTGFVFQVIFPCRQQQCGWAGSRYGPPRRCVFLRMTALLRRALLSVHLWFQIVWCAWVCRRCSFYNLAEDRGLRFSNSSGPPKTSAQAGKCIELISIMQRIGKGGPRYTEPALTGEAFWDDSGKLRRRSVLDNYSQHTHHCGACSRVSFHWRFKNCPGLHAWGLFLALLSHSKLIAARGLCRWQMRVRVSRRWYNVLFTINLMQAVFRQIQTDHKLKLCPSL